MRKISEYEIINHGIEHEQYFQGCGVAFTQWEECFTGCGSTAFEALEDALESAAQTDIDTSTVINDLPKELPESTAETIGQEDVDILENLDFHFYVSLRVKLAAVETLYPVKCRFVGRRIGAIGITYRIETSFMVTNPENLEAIRETLYQKFECIQGLRIVTSVYPTAADAGFNVIDWEKI